MHGCEYLAEHQISILLHSNIPVLHGHSQPLPIEALLMFAKLMLVAKNDLSWCSGECKSPKTSRRSTDPS